MDEKKLGLRDVVAVSVGLVIATSSLVSLGQGAGRIGELFIVAMIIACIFNMITMATMAELNALMPNTTGGLAQYTLAGIGPLPTMVLMVGGYFASNILSSGVEASIFAYAMGEVIPLPLPNYCWTLLISVIILIANLRGVDMFAKIQNLVCYLLLGSMLIMGLIGVFGLGTGAVVRQPAVMNATPKNVIAMTATAFWLFIGAEYAIPISKDVRNAKRNVPLGMFLGLGLICLVQSIMVLGFHRYTRWTDLMNSAAPHMLYGSNLLGMPGKIWMAFVAALAVISSQNSSVQALSAIAQGMTKMNMMPQCFGKTNRYKVPHVGVWFVTIAILVCGYISQDSSERISFLIQVGSVFWMLSYIVAHIDLLVFRKRLPHAPRNFKVPGGPVLPLIGISGIVYMICNISTDFHTRMMIYLATGVTFAALSVWSVLWIKLRMKMPLMKPVPINKVLAMENSMFYKVRRNKGLCR